MMMKKRWKLFRVLLEMMVRGRGIGGVVLVGVDLGLDFLVVLLRNGGVDDDEAMEGVVDDHDVGDD